MPRAPHRARIVFGVFALIAVCVAMVVGAAALGDLVGRTFSGPPGALTRPSGSDPRAAEATELFAEQYPGWTYEGIRRRDYYSGRYPVVEYVITTTAPGCDYPIGIVYTSMNDNALVVSDKILRDDGPYHGTRAESLWETLGQEYAEHGYTIVAVKSTVAGNVRVEWEATVGTGLGRRDWHAVDEVTRNESTHTWMVNEHLY